MTATPRYYPAEDAPKTTKKVVAKVQNVSLSNSHGQTLLRSMNGGWALHQRCKRLHLRGCPLNRKMMIFCY